MKLLETSAAVCTLLYVWLAARGIIWCWPFGIAGAVLYIIFDVHVKYYQDALVQTYYVFAGIYGLYYWKTHSNTFADVYVSRPLKEMWLPVALCAVLVLPFGYLFSALGNAYSYLDSATTLFSFLATWYTARKVLQSWLIWILVDVALAIQFLLKSAYITSSLYLLLACMALYGYAQWKQKL
ncbi:MAG: nicotinamide riboside transporter PnuC [Chitinophagales bacterium]|nr:nicotinamide riboside transporter PnuC [Chitinophagales bacterium]MDW8418670.1 nicotinamide riboside transporter PnuC [Chitinophagales bacterium]